MIWGAEGQCFWCGEIGHSVRECPEAPAPCPAPVVRPGRLFGGYAVTSSAVIMSEPDALARGLGDLPEEGDEKAPNAEIHAQNSPLSNVVSRPVVSCAIVPGATSPGYVTPVATASVVSYAVAVPNVVLPNFAMPRVIAPCAVSPRVVVPRAAAVPRGVFPCAVSPGAVPQDCVIPVALPSVVSCADSLVVVRCPVFPCVVSPSVSVP